MKPSLLIAAFRNKTRLGAEGGILIIRPLLQLHVSHIFSFSLGGGGGKYSKHFLFFDPCTDTWSAPRAFSPSFRMRCELWYLPLFESNVCPDPPPPPLSHLCKTPGEREKTFSPSVVKDVPSVMHFSIPPFGPFPAGAPGHSRGGRSTTGGQCRRRVSSPSSFLEESESFFFLRLFSPRRFE